MRLQENLAGYCRLSSLSSWIRARITLFWSGVNAKIIRLYYLCIMSAIFLFLCKKEQNKKSIAVIYLFYTQNLFMVHYHAGNDWVKHDANDCVGCIINRFSWSYEFNFLLKLFTFGWLAILGIYASIIVVLLAGNCGQVCQVHMWNADMKKYDDGPNVVGSHIIIYNSCLRFGG